MTKVLLIVRMLFFCLLCNYCLAQPNAPIAVAALNPTLCGTSSIITATNTPLVIGGIYNWYTQASGGTAVFTGNPYITPILYGATTYYVDVTDPVGMLTSTRTAVTITILNLSTIVPASSPAAINICPGQTTTLTASTTPSGTYTYNWYDAALGGNLLHTGITYNVSPTTTTSYYVEAVDINGCKSATRGVSAVAVVPNTDIVTATSNNPTPCPGQSLNLIGASTLNYSTFKWYSSPTGNDLLFSGNPYTISATTTPTSYFVETTSPDGCKSVRGTIVITAVPNVEVVIATPTPITPCPGGNVSLMATTSGSSTIFEWYDSASGGSLLFTGNPYNVTATNSLINYYVQTVNANGCKSVRGVAAVIGTPNADVVTVTNSNNTPCPGAMVALTAASAANNTIFKWYDAASGGTLLFTGNPYNVTATSSLQTFFVESINASGCASIRGIATVLGVPNADVVTVTNSNNTPCPGAMVA